MKMRHVYLIKLLTICSLWSQLVAMEEQNPTPWAQKFKDEYKKEKKRKRERSPSRNNETVKSEETEKKQKIEPEEEKKQIFEPVTPQNFDQESKEKEALENLNNLIVETIETENLDRKKLLTLVKKIDQQIAQTSTRINLSGEDTTQTITPLRTLLKQNMTKLGAVVDQYLTITDVSEKNSEEYQEVQELLETFKKMCQETKTKIAIIPLKYIKMDTTRDLEIAQEEERVWNQKLHQPLLEPLEDQQEEIQNISSHTAQETVTITCISLNKTKKVHHVPLPTLNNQSQMLRLLHEDIGNIIEIKTNFPESTMTRLFNCMQRAQELESQGSFYRKNTIEEISNELLIESNKKQEFLAKEICPLVIAANLYNCPAVFYGAALALLQAIDFNTLALQGLTTQLVDIEKKFKEGSDIQSFSILPKFSSHAIKTRNFFSLLYFFLQKKPLTQQLHELDFSIEELISSGAINIQWPNRHKHTPMDMVCDNTINDLESYILEEYPTEIGSCIMQLPGTSDTKKRIGTKISRLITIKIAQALDNSIPEKTILEPWLENITDPYVKKIVIKELVTQLRAATSQELLHNQVHLCEKLFSDMQQLSVKIGEYQETRLLEKSHKGKLDKNSLEITLKEYGSQAQQINEMTKKQTLFTHADHEAYKKIITLKKQIINSIVSLHKFFDINKFFTTEELKKYFEPLNEFTALYKLSITENVAKSYDQKLLQTIMVFDQWSKECCTFDPTPDTFYSQAFKNKLPFEYIKTMWNWNVFSAANAPKSVKVPFYYNNILSKNVDMLNIVLELIEPIFNVVITELDLDGLHLTEIPPAVFGLNLTTLLIRDNQLPEKTIELLKNKIKIVKYK